MAKKNKQKTKSSIQSKPIDNLITESTINEVSTMESLVDSILPGEDSEDGIDMDEIESSFTDDGNELTQSPDECIKKIKHLLHILEGTQKKYEEKKNEYISKIKQVDEEKKTVDTARLEVKKEADKLIKEAESEITNLEGELREKREALNQRELELLERERESMSGDHSGIVEMLLTSFRQSESKVISDTRSFIESVADTNEEYLNRLQEVSAESAKLEKQKKKLERLRDAIEEEREEIRLEIKDELERRYAQELSDAKVSVERQTFKLQRIESDFNKVNDSLTQIYISFGETDPVQMANICAKLKGEVDDLKEQLNQCPTQEQFNNKLREIDYLKKSLQEKDVKFNEKEYYELQTMFHNNDSIIMERRNLECRLESAKVREESLRKTIDDLSATIKEINETQSKDSAFKISSQYDKGEYQVGLTRPKCPSGLKDLIAYLQCFMASNQDKSKRLYYSKDTIRKFIAGIYMSPISILQGISGTGKTSLPRAVSLALTANDDRFNAENGADELPKAAYRICPIQSGWRDKMDLMGYYNSFEKSYHETEFFNALYLANQPKYKDTLFFIVLDEMNLSRPEHYFADFLSKLELSEDQRRIKIDNVPESITPNMIKGGTLSIPRNVQFIGTANHDETTLEFAPKTYDRSNVINMPRNHPDENIPTTTERYSVTYSWLYDQFKKAEEAQEKAYSVFSNFIKDEILLELLAEEGIGIGNRFEGQAKRFISVFVEAGNKPEDDLAKAVDHLITTRLLRTLQNNYDLDTDKLNNFLDSYNLVFKTHFGKEPDETIELIRNECKKKNK